MSNTCNICPLQTNFKHLKFKFYEIGVNSLILQNFINERSPISLNQETPEASNVSH